MRQIGSAVLLALFLQAAFLPTSQGVCDEDTLFSNLAVYKDCTQKSSIYTLIDTAVNNPQEKCRSAKQDLVKCLDEYEKPIKACMDSTQRRSVDTFRASRTAYINAICKDEGQKLKDFWAKDGEKCLRDSKSRLASGCPLPHLLILKFNDTICRTQKSYLDCHNNVWDPKCTAQAKEFLNAVSKAPVDATPCYRLVNAAPKKKKFSLF